LQFPRGAFAFAIRNIDFDHRGGIDALTGNVQLRLESLDRQFSAFSAPAKQGGGDATIELGFEVIDGGGNLTPNRV
jgi:hypothetical protein